MVDRRLAMGLVVAFVVGALVAAPVLAQEAGGQDQGGGQAQDPPAAEKKQKFKGPLGLPDLKALKEALTLEKDQGKKVKELFDGYAEKVKEAEAKAKEAADKKAAKKDLDALRGEIVGKLKEILNEEQQKKLDELIAPPKKKKKEGQ